MSFAVAECASGFPWPTDAGEVVFGRAVSAFVPVAFDNLITKFSFSEAFFNPDVGQTQQASAIFTANVDWTLEIQNDSTNSVRTVTGSGTSMQFDWDGKGDGGTNLPAGVYTYLLSAETNGQSFSFYSGQSSGDSLSAAFATLDDSTELLAMPADGSGSVVPFVTYPPGFDTNNLIIFEGSMEDYQDESASLSAAESDIAMDLGGGAAAAAAGASQSTRGPVRPPTNPVNRIVGNFGLAYQDYWPNEISLQAPPNGLGLGQRIQLENTSGSTTHHYRDLGNNSANDTFIQTMKRGSWSSGFVKKNYDLRPADLRKASLGGSNIFNSGASLGMLDLHGSFGTSQDFDQASGANGAMQIYFPIDGRPNGNPSWVRMSEMDFGSPGTNGLKWMALLTCNSLREANWNSIQSAGWKPFNNDLHLLLGADSVADDGGTKLWAKFMLGLDGNTKRTIMQAWYDSGAFQSQSPPLYFAVAGYDDCQQDLLTGTNSYTPQGSIFYLSQQVKF